MRYGHCLLEKLGKETCGGQSLACPEAGRVHNWKSGCLCCLLAFPLNISCLELSFSFFLPDVHFSHLSGLDPLFTRFLFFFDIEKNTVQSLSDFIFSISLPCSHNRRDLSLCFVKVGSLMIFFLKHTIQ